MKKIDFPLFADVAFYGAAVWFLSVGILRYLHMGLALAATLASLAAVAAALLTFLLGYRSHRRRRLNKREREERDALMLHLALDGEERVLAALNKALTADGKKVRAEEGTLISDTTRFVPRFTMQPLSADETARLIRAYGKKGFTLLCNELSPEAERLAKSFGIGLLRADEIFALFARTRTTPHPLVCGELPRKKAARTARRIFSKSSARPFFTSGILLLFMSLFTFFPRYYLISGCALMLFSVLVRFFGFRPSEG